MWRAGLGSEVFINLAPCTSSERYVVTTVREMLPVEDFTEGGSGAGTGRKPARPKLLRTDSGAGANSRLASPR